MGELLPTSDLSASESFLKVMTPFNTTMDPGYNQRQGNDSGVSYNRTFLYPGFERNEISSRGQDTH